MCNITINCLLLANTHIMDSPNIYAVRPSYDYYITYIGIHLVTTTYVSIYVSMFLCVCVYVHVYMYMYVCM